MTDFDAGFEGDDLDDLARKLEELEAALEKHLTSAMETAVLLIEGTAKRLAPVDTGRLRASIESEVRQVASHVVEGHVGTNVEYAEDVEFGTDAHTITASDADALHWTEGGEDMFAQSVDHPGTPAQPFLGPAVEIHIDRIEELLSEAVDAAIAEVS